MPQIPGDNYCPVRSFEKYVNVLSPKSMNLWQTPKFTAFPVNDSTIWYYGVIGHNKLDGFISEITKQVDLSKHYTNQCLRSTAVTIFGRLKNSNKQIMSVSGHKSSTSLEIYQKVNDDEKMRMGADLSKIILKRKASEPGPNAAPQFLIHNNELYEVPKEPENPVPPKRAMVEIQNLPKNAVVPVQPKAKLQSNDEAIPNFNLSAVDLLELLSEVDDNQLMLAQETTKSQNMISQKNQLLAKKGSPTIPTFQNCQITGNITININKN